MDFVAKYARLERADLRYSKSEKPFTLITLSDKQGTDQSGKADYGYFDAIAFGDLAVNIAALELKSRVEVRGMLKQEKWEDKTTGQKRSAVKLLVFHCKPSEEDGEKRKSPPVETAAPLAEDDLPF